MFRKTNSGSRAGKISYAPSDPKFETIRSIEVAHARTQDAGPMVGVAFLRSSCGAGSRLSLVADVQSVSMQE
jgi:hypothetical protein